MEFSSQIRSEELLDNDHIAPDPIELSMFLINTNFAEAKPLHQLTAGSIFHKDTRDQFPEACRFALIHQAGKGQATGTSPSPVAPHIDRELSDTSITGALP